VTVAVVQSIPQSFFCLLGDFLIIYNLIIQSTLSSIQVNLKFGEVLDAFEGT